MIGSTPSPLVLALVAGLLVASYARAQTGPGGEAGAWLDAAEVGASGSAYETRATTVAGAKQITVADPGDFRVGQGVMVSRCNVRYTNQTLWGPRDKYGAAKPLKELVELRGYDGAAGSWIVYALDIEPGSPPTFRWTDDIGRTWHPKVPITGDWQPLGGGTEVRFGKHDWEAGYTVTFSARDQLVSRIEAIDGKVLTLRDAANRSADDAVVRHCDDAALQAAVDQAIKERRNLYVPPGWYRLTRSVVIRNAAGLSVVASSPEHTVLDISEGEGGCFALSRGTEVTLKNFKMVGHTGFADRDIAGYFNTAGARGVWGFYLKNSCAVTMAGTERVLVENCHGTKMSCECFVSGGPSRGTVAKPNTAYSKSVTYLRCSAVDCGRNGFNDWNCGPENTSVLYCRIVDVGGCAWEGASRFVKFVGNYVRNAGTVAIGNLGPDNRDASFAELAAGQHLIADNVFESRVPYGGCAIRTTRGASQVIIRNNLFVNFGSSAIEASGQVSDNGYPSANTAIFGNSMDMTDAEGTPRVAIDLSASDTIVADNQIYVRGAADPKVTAIRVSEPALNVILHDNLLRHCGVGLVTGRTISRVGQVIDSTTFVPSWRTVPLERQTVDPCRGWRLVWLAGGKPAGTSEVESFDSASCRFKLRAPRELKVGETFETVPAGGARWSFHDNLITGCLSPVVLDSYGSESSVLRGNTISRGESTGVKQAVEVRGRFDLLGNRFEGFSEPGSAALALFRDRLGTAPRNRYAGNVFLGCGQPVKAEPDLWDDAAAAANTVVE